MKARSGDHHMTIAPSKMVIHNNSHMIAKQKPKIRIIHIVAPEIIKTDLQNFRQLVQKLTGKQGSTKKGKNVSSHPKTCRSNPSKHLQSTSMSILPRMKQETEDIDGGGISNSFLSILGDSFPDSYMISMNSHYFR